MGKQTRRQFVQGTASLASLAAAFPFASVASAITETPVIKIGQIGVGHAHASKLATYRRSPDYEVVGIVEPDPKLRERAMNSGPFQGLPLMTQEQLLNVPGLQAVLVETRVRDLLPAAAACVAAGKHVHLDKPAGESLDEYQKILASAARQKLLVQMGYMYRYNPAVVLLREFLEQGWLGEVFEVHTVMSKVVGATERRALAQYPGGIMFELGCHIIDLAIGVLGKPTSVQAFAKHSSPLEDGLQDNMLAVLDYPKATATVKSSALEVDGGARRHFVVCGSEGTFHIQPLDNPAARVALSQPRGTYRKGYQELSFPKFSRYTADAADMARCIRGERKFAFSKEHDLAVQETVLRASGVLNA
jgi:predicted dehydrogenase